MVYYFGGLRHNCQSYQIENLLLIHLRIESIYSLQNVRISIVCYVLLNQDEH